jgi:hypothetical protein
MKQCPKCYTPNNEESLYCEGCGTLLRQGETSRPTSMPYQQEADYAQYSSPPIQYPVPEAGYRTLPAPPTYTQNYAPTHPTANNQIPYNNRNERKRSKLGLTLGILLYVVGSATAAFGVASMLLITGNDTIAGAGFLITFPLALLALIFILILHRHPRLRGWLRVGLFVGISILSFIALIAAFANHPANQPTTHEEFLVLGIICLIYGTGMAIIALI